MNAQLVLEKNLHAIVILSKYRELAVVKCLMNHAKFESLAKKAASISS